MKTKLFSLFVLLLTLAFTATPARADGIIIPEPPICDPSPCPMPRPPMEQLAIRYHRPRPVAWEAICRWGWSRLVGLFAVASRDHAKKGDGFIVALLYESTLLVTTRSVVTSLPCLKRIYGLSVIHANCRETVGLISRDEFLDKFGNIAFHYALQIIG